ncbi:HNH endonuclease [Euzebya tangerina]|uniref:HNH endonuclease n=1 Tax=Euzebya tangerina TaxID=591198 RepID=UPI001F0C97C7|nr:HNH endonuclease [Euzebya tangerina]
MSALLTPPRDPVEQGPADARPFTSKALVLNASMEPLSVVPGRRALVLVLTGKADLVVGTGATVHSEHLQLDCPSVVQLRRYVRVPYRRRASLTRRGVFIRDEHRCQYCDAAAENIDHVHPRSRNGKHEWENVVAACTRCNSRKGNRTPAEAGMRLARAPFAPKAAFWMVVAVGRVKPEWELFLGDAVGDRPASVSGRSDLGYH